jgi:hypothetical protein
MDSKQSESHALGQSTAAKELAEATIFCIL